MLGGDLGHSVPAPGPPAASLCAGKGAWTWWCWEVVTWCLGLLWGLKGCSSVSCAIVGSLVVGCSCFPGDFPFCSRNRKAQHGPPCSTTSHSSCFPSPNLGKATATRSPHSFSYPPCLPYPTPAVNLAWPQPLGTAMPGPARDREKKPYQSRLWNINLIWAFTVREEALRLNHASPLGLHAFVPLDKWTIKALDKGKLITVGPKTRQSRLVGNWGYCSRLVL